jgi:hypothetical protein
MWNTCSVYETLVAHVEHYIVAHLLLALIFLACHVRSHCAALWRVVFGTFLSWVFFHES